jgi:phospholipase C
VSKTGLPWRTVFDLTVNANLPSFMEDVAAGTLPSVSWIDPAFTNFNPLGFPVNDDHPPADIQDGQDLVLAVYDALAAGPQWEHCVLVVVYDEHGGFFDHVAPPSAPDDDPAEFGRYGVRVPALIVSPWVERRSVCSTVFDHTSIIKTILARFCPESLDESSRAHRAQPKGVRRPGHLGTRVAQADHFGELLSRRSPRPAPSRHQLVRRASARTAPAPRQSEAAGPAALNDLQRSIRAATQELARRGHPANTP